MPKANTGGASDQSVHPDYIAPAGIPPQEALDNDMPDQGAAPEEPREADAAPDTGERHDRAAQGVNQRSLDPGERQSGEQREKQTDKQQSEPATKSAPARKSTSAKQH